MQFTWHWGLPSLSPKFLPLLYVLPSGLTMVVFCEFSQVHPAATGESTNCVGDHQYSLLWAVPITVIKGTLSHLT